MTNTIIQTPPKNSSCSKGFSMLRSDTNKYAIPKNPVNKKIAHQTMSYISININSPKNLSVTPR